MSFTHDKRIIIYPNYINKLRTVAEGRRIPTAQACEDPNPLEMFDCCKYLKLPADIEDKHYSRDWMIRGRLRVQLKNEDGTPVNPEVPTRRALLLKIAELVPKHPSRSKAKQAAAAQQAVAAAKQQEDAAGSSSKAAGSSKGSSKKKGKK